MAARSRKWKTERRGQQKLYRVKLKENLEIDGTDTAFTREHVQKPRANPPFAAHADDWRTDAEWAGLEERGYVTQQAGVNGQPASRWRTGKKKVF
ncbi:hypothetical protein Z043_117881 [Scleropages formosus]|uniref:Uncharacterized protein n=1 Tax=Scleropages formosus TaxID=113540 RepID=A0A0P7U885_SCLFO|nr:hypothetical protein Z043_117881 [Scleropages formosus]